MLCVEAGTLSVVVGSGPFIGMRLGKLGLRLRRGLALNLSDSVVAAPKYLSLRGKCRDWIRGIYVTLMKLWSLVLYLILTAAFIGQPYVQAQTTGGASKAAASSAESLQSQVERLEMSAGKLTDPPWKF